MDEMELQMMEFFSWEDFCIFFDDWCEKRKMVFFLRHYVSLQKCKWATESLDWELVEALKYSSARLTCKNINSANKNEILPPNEGKEINAPEEEESKEQLGCSAYVLLKLSEKKNSLVIFQCQLQHNHPLCPVEFSYYLKKRGLLLATCCIPVRFTNTISKQFVGSVDVKRLLSYCRCKEHSIMGTLVALDKLFAADPDAKVKLVFLQGKVIVSTIFIVTSVMSSMCQRFPSVLFFFKVLSFNRDYDLYSYLCANDFGQGKICAYILVRKGTSNILRFASASLVQSIPHIKFKVRCVIVGVDIREKEVAKHIFPNAAVQILRSQVLQTLLKKALEMGVKDDQMLLALFSRIATSKTPEGYNQTVRSMSLYCKDSFVKYFMDQWHTCRDMWVDIWGFNFATNLDTSEIVIQHKQKLIDLLDSNATVAQCISHVTATSLIYKSLKDGDIASQYKALCTPDAASMIEEELCFLVDCQYNTKLTSTGYSINDGVSEFFMDQDLITCSCTIHTSSLLPCRHLFATRLQNGEDLFDLKLLSKSETACK